MKVYAPGTDVTITAAEVFGKIQSVNIGYNGVTYDVVYYISGSRYLVTCNECEFMVQADMKKISVGFK